MAEFPPAVPEIPVSDIDAALDYYNRRLGFDIDWGDGGGGIAGISQGTAACSSPTPPSASTTATALQR